MLILNNRICCVIMQQNITPHVIGWYAQWNQSDRALCILTKVGHALVRVIDASHALSAPLIPLMIIRLDFRSICNDNEGNPICNLLYRLFLIWVNGMCFSNPWFRVGGAANAAGIVRGYCVVTAYRTVQYII